MVASLSVLTCERWALSASEDGAVLESDEGEVEGGEWSGQLGGKGRQRACAMKYAVSVMLDCLF